MAVQRLALLHIVVEAASNLLVGRMKLAKGCRGDWREKGKVPYLACPVFSASTPDA